MAGKTGGSLARHAPDNIRRVHGVDFSGAKDACKRIWIASGEVRDGRLEIQECFAAQYLPGSGRDREQCLRALRDFIERHNASVFGIDFPFGLPRELVKNVKWERFVRSFAGAYPDPETFREACLRGGEGAELKRITDIESQSPFSPYNLRLYRQTYYGIAQVLAPLVRRGLVRVPPMQKATPGKPWILEVCPASTLKRLGLYVSYKGRTAKKRAARAKILKRLEKLGMTYKKAEPLRSSVLSNASGDALDSVIIAFAVSRLLRKPDQCTIEGYIYT
ncbi:DUF429 domain-containing protein [bacterium]|nr:DUF429 domain-containing protein [bacterium]